MSIFASFNFSWPSELVNLFHSLSLASFNLELLAPECSFSVDYEGKWLATAALPILLVVAVAMVWLATTVLQLCQQYVFRSIPFGALSEFNVVDICIGVLITGSYYLYFCKCCCPLMKA